MFPVYVDIVELSEEYRHYLLPKAATCSMYILVDYQLAWIISI